MKKIFTYAFLFICFTAHGQRILDWNLSFNLNFDSSNKGNVLNNDHGYGIVIWDTFHYDGWIYIDTVTYKHNEWQIGIPHKSSFDSAYSLPNAMITNTIAACLPNDTSVFIMKYPGVCDDYTTTILALQFKYKLDLDPGDIAKIDFSIDSGKSWVDADSLPKSGLFVGPDTLLSDTTKGWQRYTAYPGYRILSHNDTALVRFTLITGSDTTPRNGWMIDDVMMTYIVYEGVPNVNKAAFELYPNPANSNVKLKLTQALSTDCVLTVVDALGRQVYTDRIKKSSSEYSLQVKDWAQGIYFIELNDGKELKAVKKLMVE